MRYIELPQAELLSRWTKLFLVKRESRCRQRIPETLLIERSGDRSDRGLQMHYKKIVSHYSQRNCRFVWELFRERLDRIPFCFLYFLRIRLGLMKKLSDILNNPRAKVMGCEVSVDSYVTLKNTLENGLVYSVDRLLMTLDNAVCNWEAILRRLLGFFFRPVWVTYFD